MAKTTGARILAEMLGRYGVTHVFFVPSILKRTMYEMEEHTNIQRILTHGEKAAAYMADGYARATGRPGVCMAQLVGAANLAAGLRDAYLACSPVIAMTGGPNTLSRGRAAYQQIDDFAMFKSVTKFSAHIDSVERVGDLVRQAFRASTVGKPGPVHLEFEGRTGVDIDAAESDMPVVVEERFSRLPPFRPSGDPQSIAQAAELLASAERPIVVAGGGVRWSAAGGNVLELADLADVPVATSLNAKDTIPSDHPLYVGVVGSYSHDCANQAVLEADLVVFIGSQTGGQVTADWTVPAPGTRVIQIDIDPLELGRHYPVEAAIQGDAKAVLQQIIVALRGRPLRKRSSWIERVQALAAQWRREIDAVISSDTIPLRPERLCTELTKSLPGDAIVVSDTGHAGIWSGCFLDLTNAHQSYLRSAGSLGWAFPAALGAKAAMPERPVVAFTGDGGFWYHIGELETAVRMGLSAVVVVNNNRSLNQEAPSWEQAYGGHLHGRHYEGWQFSEIDFARVAESMGAKGIRVARPKDFAPALEEALASKKPSVIDVVTDISAIAPPPLTRLQTVPA